MGQLIDGAIAIPSSSPAAGPALSLRSALRAATAETHERLHRHSGFAALAAGALGLRDYRSLLARLYGFHAAFERAAGFSPVRTAWLAADLAALGADAEAIALTPRCLRLPRLDGADRRLGARYVVEGSALGGRQLATSLDGVLGRVATGGRAFFTGHGPHGGGTWRGVLGELEACERAGGSRAEVLAGACDCFECFEAWLAGWAEDGVHD